MTAAALIARLDRVRQTGSGRWIACCPAHEDKSPSLTIRELDDGRVLVHCFADCEVEDVLAAVGMAIEDLFPARCERTMRPLARPFPAADILRAIAFEALVVATSGAALLDGGPFSKADRERLSVAVGRINAALVAGGLRHERG